MIKIILEAIDSFFKTYGLTLLAATVSCVCVGCLVELFKQSLFAKKEAALKEEIAKLVETGDQGAYYKELNDKLTKVKTVKAASACALAALLTAFFLACVWKSKLPNIGDTALLPIWFTIMYILQLFVDIKTLKNIIGRILGNIIKEPRKKKMKKVVNWVEVEEE